MKIKFVKTNPDAILPAKNHDCPLLGDAGFDLFSVEDVRIEPGEAQVVDVGLKLGYVDPGFFFRIEARSGLGFKKSLQPHFGIIDNGYRGELGVKVYNFSSKVQYIGKGQGCAQLIVYPMVDTDVEFIKEEEVNFTERGTKGFGSSDKI